MIERSPATSLIAALDEPWRFLRAEFPRWAPAAYPIACVGLIPGLITAWGSANLTTRLGAEPDIPALISVYAGSCGSVFVYIGMIFGAFAIVNRTLQGEQPTVVDAIMGAFSPRMLLVGGIAMGMVFIGFGCVVGGPLVAAIFGFVPAILTMNRDTWFGAWGTAVELASRRVSPRDAGAPAWKLAALFLVWYGIQASLNQMVALPNFAWMVWHMVTTLGSGNLAEMFQIQPPFPLGALTALLATLLRPFSDIYLAAGTLLLLRDLQRVRSGQDLAALVEARPPEAP